MATGERPRLPEIPGVEHCISSDDLFSLMEPPGKTLVIGASYVALECAGFLVSLGFDTTVMVRSIFLRGFDQQCANIIGNHLEKEAGAKMLKTTVPVSVEKLESGKLKGKYKKKTYPEINDHLVTMKNNETGEESSDEFDTVMMAIGREPCTRGIGFDNVNVELAKNGKVIVNDKEETNVENIYAIGDILLNRLELTPVAIQVDDVT